MARSITSVSLLRLVACIAALSLTLVFGMRPAVAGPPSADDGCSGGGTSETDDTGMMIEEVGLVPTNGAPGSFTMEETSELPGWALTDSERSIQLIEGTFAPGGYLAGWDDIAAAQGPVLVGSGPERDASATEAVAASGEADFALTANERSTAMNEDKLTSDGHLAGWDDIAAAERAALASAGSGGRPAVQAS